MAGSGRGMTFVHAHGKRFDDDNLIVAALRRDEADGTGRLAGEREGGRALDR